MAKKTTSSRTKSESIPAEKTAAPAEKPARAAAKPAARKAPAKKPADKKGAKKSAVPTVVSAAHEPTDEEIRVRAYHRYLERGGHRGADFDDWLEARRDLLRQRT